MIALFEQGFDDNGKYSEIIGGFPHFFLFREMVFGGLLEKIGGFWGLIENFGENWRKGNDMLN